MATYPDDATAPVTAFGVVADVIYTNTGATRTDFNLASKATHRGEIVAFIDGVLQQTSGYDEFKVKNNMFALEFGIKF